MGFLKGLSGFAGKVVGGVVGGGLELIGEVVDSNFIKEVGEGVYNVTVNSAEMIGTLADSAVTTVHGIAIDDDEKIKKGLSEAGGVVKSTAIGVGKTISHSATNAGQIINGVFNDDLEAAGRGARELAKTVVIGSLSIGLCDFVDAPPVMAATEMVGDLVVAATEMVGDTVVAATEMVASIGGGEVVANVAGEIAGKAATGIVSEITNSRVSGIMTGEVVEGMTTAFVDNALQNA